MPALELNRVEAPPHRQMPQQQAGLSLRRRRTIWWLRGLSLLITLVLWEWYDRNTNPMLFTYPTAIACATVDMMADGTLLKALGQSMQVLTIGFALGRLIGVALGLLIGRSVVAAALIAEFYTAISGLGSLIVSKYRRAQLFLWHLLREKGLARDTSRPCPTGRPSADRTGP